MAFDGVVIAALTSELNHTILGGRISKIAQPETDELLLTIKNNKETYKLILNASASLSFLYLTEENKISPLTAPAFCMVLRKHLQNGKIISVTQPGLERIVKIEIEHFDEMNDLCSHTLIIEIMGKHSNIVLVNKDSIIIDSIKRIPAHISSIREVLPGREYFIPNTQNKADPLTCDEALFSELIHQPYSLTKSLSQAFTGISTPTAEEILEQAKIDNQKPANTLSDLEKVHLYHTFKRFINQIARGDFGPTLYYKGDKPLDFSAFKMLLYQDCPSVSFDSMSLLLETFYAQKSVYTRMQTKSADLRRIVSNALERTKKKLDLQEKQLRDTTTREKHKLYGDLLTTYAYELTSGASVAHVTNYYDNTLIDIPLNSEDSIIDNAKRYYEKYAKAKRTFDALTTQIEETKNELSHLISVEESLKNALNEIDLKQIKLELTRCGYCKKNAMIQKGNKKAEKQAKIVPLHYLSSDGYDIYVGKNNIQNEFVTFELAAANDFWFHVKGVPGSHVILKTKGEEIPDRAFEEAGAVAAYYSQNRNSDKVEVDYIEKKFIKKPSGGKPGFVIYHNNYSLIAIPDISSLKSL